MNRLKVVLFPKNKIVRWFVNELGKNPITSK